MDRRNFIAGTAAAVAAGVASGAFAVSGSEVESEPLTETKLTSVWTDVYLREPSSIVIAANKDGSEVKVTGTYWNEDHGQSIFQGIGQLAGNTLTLNYNHELNPHLGDGQLKMKLVKVDKVLILKGTCKKNDSTWNADSMTWYKQRR